MANLKISMQNPDSKTRQRTENKMSGMGFGLGINSNFYHFSKKVAVGTLATNPILCPAGSLGNACRFCSKLLQYTFVAD
jgi:hypothetical protein